MDILKSLDALAWDIFKSLAKNLGGIIIGAISIFAIFLILKVASLGKRG